MTVGEQDPDAGPHSEVLELFDLLGRRWALRVLWELREPEQTYRDIAAKVPEMSTSVLTQRLRDLRSALLIEHERGSGYRLTAEGRELVAHLERLRSWAERIRFSPGVAP